MVRIFCYSLYIQYIYIPHIGREFFIFLNGLSCLQNLLSVVDHAQQREREITHTAAADMECHWHIFLIILRVVFEEQFVFCGAFSNFYKSKNTEIVHLQYRN